ncbi:PTS sugar transporter subunit IIC [Bacillaceae bacterium Marseille-Q3522]|nr:PTS sugar transporter subunit IIC [Bacillaceae bacterium Marseille-Q3522]
MSVTQALLIGLWVALVQSRILGYGPSTFRASPLMTGFVVGLIMGDVAQGMIVVTAIQLIYMGAIAPGGTLPSEPVIAAAVAVPAAIIGNLTPEAAVAIAVPVGLLGSYLYQFRFFLNTFFTKLIDKYAAQANSRGLAISIVVIPTIISFLLFTPTLFITSYFGAPVIADFVKSISNGPVLHVLDVVGGGLAAVGISVIIHVIGKKVLLPFFFLGFFMSTAFSSLEINTVTYAIFGVIFAFLYVMFTSNNLKTE